MSIFFTGSAGSDAETFTFDEQDWPVLAGLVPRLRVELAHKLQEQLDEAKDFEQAAVEGFLDEALAYTNRSPSKKPNLLMAKQPNLENSDKVTEMNLTMCLLI